MDNEVIDLKDFLDRVQDDKDLMLELFDIFMSDYQEKRQSLKEAVAKKDYEQMKSLAHSLKGASGNISAKALRAIFIRLEEIGKANSLAGIEPLLNDLDLRYNDLVKRINEIKKEFQNA